MEECNNSCTNQDFREYQFIRKSPRHWYVFLCIANVVLSISAIVGNSIILIALFQCRTIYSSSKALFYSLALSDFGVGLIAQPLQVATGLGALRGNLELFCSVQPFYAAVGIPCGLLVMTAPFGCFSIKTCHFRVANTHNQ